MSVPENGHANTADLSAALVCLLSRRRACPAPRCTALSRLHGTPAGLAPVAVPVA